MPFKIIEICCSLIIPAQKKKKKNYIKINYHKSVRFKNSSCSNQVLIASLEPSLNTYLPSCDVIAAGKGSILANS